MTGAAGSYRYAAPMPMRTTHDHRMPAAILVVMRSGTLSRGLAPSRKPHFCPMRMSIVAA